MMQTIESPSGLTIYHLGPEIKRGALPALFYFALSGSDSLNLDPYNQPIQLLSHLPLRLFSFTIPYHAAHQDKTKAMAGWAAALGTGHNIVEEFVDQSIENIDYLISEELIDRRHLAVAGLSRGGFLATHLAARDHRIKTILGFAPVTQLTLLEEFKPYHNHSLVQSLALEKLIDKLTHKQLRFYIGNRDLRVGTMQCFQFIAALADAIYQHGHRSPPVELMINPSVGHKGHGTLPHIFQDGVEWLKIKLNLRS